MGQETMFERGAVDGDLVHPDDVEGRMRELIASLLRFRASVELREQDREVLARRTVPARSHWLPFPAMIFNGRAVGVVGVRSE